MEDVWLQKLYLPSLDIIPPTVLVSVLNCWYKNKNITNANLLKTVEVTSHEKDLLEYLKLLNPHSVIAGGAAAEVIKQPHCRKTIDVFIPIYCDIEKHIIPSLKGMVQKNSRTTPTTPGVQKLVEFCDIFTGHHDTIRSNSLRERNIQFCYESINIIWIEIPIDFESFFAKHVPPRALFIFYLLAATFDIVTYRSAIVDWRLQNKNDFQCILHPTEILDLIYTLPGYNHWLLQPVCHYYNYNRHLVHMELTNNKFWDPVVKKHLINSEKKLLEDDMRKRFYHLLPIFKEIDKKYKLYSTYIRTNGKDGIVSHTNYRSLSLTHICLGMLVSLSDLSWVKFSKNFPHTRYNLLVQAKNMILQRV